MKFFIFSIINTSLLFSAAELVNPFSISDDARSYVLKNAVEVRKDLKKPTLIAFMDFSDSDHPFRLKHKGLDPIQAGFLVRLENHGISVLMAMMCPELIFLNGQIICRDVYALYLYLTLWPVDKIEIDTVTSFVKGVERTNGSINGRSIEVTERQTNKKRTIENRINDESVLTALLCCEAIPFEYITKKFSIELIDAEGRKSVEQARLRLSKGLEHAKELEKEVVTLSDIVYEIPRYMRRLREGRLELARAIERSVEREKKGVPAGLVRLIITAENLELKRIQDLYEVPECLKIFSPKVLENNEAMTANTDIYRAMLSEAEQKYQAASLKQRWNQKRIQMLWVYQAKD